MALDFYCGSGSPYAWRVWSARMQKLAIVQKTLPPHWK